MDLKSVPAIKKGGVIGIVSPSWAGPAAFPHVFELGINRLTQLFGVSTKYYPTTLTPESVNHSNPASRAHDLIAAFNDPETCGVIASIGGSDAVRLLPYLDNQPIPPKFFMGYSDSTVILHYLHTRGMVSFHGPSVMAGFAEPGELRPEQIQHYQSFLAGNWESYHYQPFTEYTEEAMHWEDKSSLSVPRTYLSKQTVVSSPRSFTSVSGTLWGGCMEALEMMKGTKYWNPPTNWEDTIAFFEIADEPMSEGHLYQILRNYGVAGLFRSKAIMLGRVPALSGLTNVSLIHAFMAVSEEFESSVPIVGNLDFGHTYPQWIIPLGSPAKISVGSNGELDFAVTNPFIRQN